jgi:predicted DsbA family dithiol-disulfide isomerase
MAVIEVFADITCPFTHVGLQRFVQRREQLGRSDVTLLVRSWPLELVNGEPMDPAFVGHKVDDIRSQVAPDLFGGFSEASFPRTSLPALALAAAANAADTRIGERVGLALRDLLFEQGVDIADLAVLQRLAVEHGVAFDPADTSLVLADYADGQARGVVGSPHFFTPFGDFFCPALDVKRDDDGNLQIKPDPAGFEKFVVACLDA